MLPLQLSAETTKYAHADIAFWRSRSGNNCRTSIFSFLAWEWTVLQIRVTRVVIATSNRQTASCVELSITKLLADPIDLQTAALVVDKNRSWWSSNELSDKNAADYLTRWPDITQLLPDTNVDCHYSVTFLHISGLWSKWNNRSYGPCTCHFSNHLNTSFLG